MTEKLYVGNLTFTTTEAEVRQLFAQAGTVTQCEVIKDRDSGQSKGFAFVTMASPAEAQKAIGRFHGASLAGRKLTVNAARPREREPQTGGYQSSLGAFGAGQSGAKKGPRKPGNAQGGYQSSLGAFGGGPPPPRRRGGGGTPRH